MTRSLGEMGTRISPNRCAIESRLMLVSSLGASFTFHCALRLSNLSVADLRCSGLSSGEDDLRG